MRSIRAALDRLGYKPDVEFFQFSKQTPRGSVKIDLLTCDVPAEHVEKVKLSLPRVRPRRQCSVARLPDQGGAGAQPVAL